MVFQRFGTLVISALAAGTIGGSMIVANDRDEDIGSFVREEECIIDLHDALPDCSDSIDNDSDGLIDGNDSGCENAADESESFCEQTKDDRVDQTVSFGGVQGSDAAHDEEDSTRDTQSSEEKDPCDNANRNSSGGCSSGKERDAYSDEDQDIDDDQDADTDDRYQEYEGQASDPEETDKQEESSQDREIFYQ